MHPPSRVRRILKWTGVGLSLVILTAWAVTLNYDFFLTIGQESALGLSFGGFEVTESANHGFVATFAGIRERKWRGFGIDLPALKTYPLDANFPAWDITTLRIPLWLPLLLTAIPTAWLWHRDQRRIRPGCCLRCGYDLTGNTSGVCSECGDKVHPPVVLADSECGEKATAREEIGESRK